MEEKDRRKRAKGSRKRAKGRKMREEDRRNEEEDGWKLGFLVFYPLLQGSQRGHVTPFLKI
jgi:hypothetical protein